MACAASLCGLGASAEGTPEGMTATVATLQRWVLTIVGPVAETVWAWQPTERVATHSSARCLLCKTFAIYGSCSHCYVAFRVSGLLREESKLAEVAPKQRLRSKGALLTPTKAPLKPDLGSEAAREPEKRASDVSLDLRRLLLHGLHGFTDLVAQCALGCFGAGVAPTFPGRTHATLFAGHQGRRKFQGAGFVLDVVGCFVVSAWGPLVTPSKREWLTICIACDNVRVTGFAADRVDLSWLPCGARALGQKLMTVRST